METYKLFNRVNNLDEQRALFFKKNIKSINTKELPYRIIFFPKDRGPKLNLDDPVARQCNGYILSIDNSGKVKPVVIPPPLLSYHINNSVVNNNMALYDIFNIQDGTTINLYWWEPLNSWRLSTSKGYDVTDLAWNGNKSYQSVFHSLLNNKLKITPEKFYEKLNKTYCYTFGFNHKDYHPFCKNYGNIWFIQSVDLDLEKNPLFSISYESPINNINSQLLHPINELKYKSLDDKKLENQTTEYKITNIQHLRKICENALDNYKNDSTKVNFGFILKSRKPNATQRYTNIIIESSLLRKIRELCYNNYYKQKAKLNGFDREKYMILHNYVNSNTRSIFLLLFPNYNNIIKKIEKKIQDIINTVIKEYQTRKITFYQSNKLEISPNKENINYIISYIDNNIDINIDDQTHIQYISQVVQSLQMIKVLYNIIFENKS